MQKYRMDKNDMNRFFSHALVALNSSLIVQLIFHPLDLIKTRL
jgi:hypothetical protein